MSVTIAQLPIEEVREYLFNVDVFYCIETDRYYNFTVPSKDPYDYDDVDEYTKAINTLCRLVSAHDEWDYNDEIQHVDIPIDKNQTIGINPLTGAVILIDNDDKRWSLYAYKFSPYQFAKLPTKKEQADVK